MPHIPEEQRIPQLVAHPETKGQFNYAITSLINDWLLVHPFEYDTLVDIAGGMDLASFEFKRLVVGPYEDTKIELNGNAYTFLDQEPPITGDMIRVAMISDGRNTWTKCVGDPDCGLHVVGPGRVYCEACDPEFADAVDTEDLN